MYLEAGVVILEHGKLLLDLFGGFFLDYEFLLEGPDLLLLFGGLFLKELLELFGAGLVAG